MNRYNLVMDARPLGIFDSGIGGLTVLRHLHHLLPHESTVYIGDTARIPYGSRSPQTITRYTQDLIDVLLKQQVKAIIAACNTASAVALPQLSSSCPVPLIGVIEPTVAALSPSSNHKIGIIGTRATINSHAYQTALLRNHPQISLTAIACPLFVPLAEEGIVSDEGLAYFFDLYLSPLQTDPVDKLILGCTHYPLLMPALKRYLPKQTQLIDPGLATAHYLKQYLGKHQLASPSSAPLKHRYYVTDDPSRFKQLAQTFLQAKLSTPPQLLIVSD